MKRYACIALAALAIVLCANMSWSEDDPLSTTIVLKNNWMKPENGKGFFTQGMWTFIHKGNIGGGFESYADYRNGYYQIDPFITYDKGPWSGLIGFSSNNFGNNFVQVGFWYAKTYGEKLSVFVDIRNYFSVSEKPNSYLDNFVEVTYPIGEKFYAGIDLEYIKWWESNSHQLLFVGPLVGYKLSKNVHIFLRGSRSWDKKEKIMTETDQVRLGFKFMF